MECGLFVSCGLLKTLLIRFLNSKDSLHRLVIIKCIIGFDLFLAPSSFLHSDTSLLSPFITVSLLPQSLGRPLSFSLFPIIPNPYPPSFLSPSYSILPSSPHPSPPLFSFLPFLSPPPLPSLSVFHPLPYSHFFHHPQPPFPPPLPLPRLFYVVQHVENGELYSTLFKADIMNLSCCGLNSR